MPEYRVKKPFRFKGKAYMSGTVKDIPEPQASMLAERGFLEPSGIPEVEEIEEIKPGVNLDQFLEQADEEDDPRWGRMILDGVNYPPLKEGACR